jgi:hypothetical protein
MDDGPESADGTYEYGAKTYRLEERESEVWSVYDGDRYLGIVERADTTPAREGPVYVAHAAGDEELPDIEPTDDWHLALEYLIDNTAPPLGD